MAKLEKLLHPLRASALSVRRSYTKRNFNVITTVNIIITDATATPDAIHAFKKREERSQQVIQTSKCKFLSFILIFSVHDMR